jgi:hypothetical protein
MPYFDKYDEEFVALRQLVERKREHFPELSLAECVHLAVEELNDPNLVQDQEYRRFLLERLQDGGSSDPDV